MTDWLWDLQHIFHENESSKNRTIHRLNNVNIRSAPVVASNELKNNWHLFLWETNNLKDWCWFKRKFYINSSYLLLKDFFGAFNYNSNVQYSQQCILALIKFTITNHFYIYRSLLPVLYDLSNYWVIRWDNHRYYMEVKWLKRFNLLVLFQITGSYTDILTHVTWVYNKVSQFLCRQFNKNINAL